MPLILNIETATKNCSVALANGGVTIALKEFAGEGYTHAEKLHVFIEGVLKEPGVSHNQIDAVAVSMGPGSYTGLRIGVSAAKGLCYALDVPLIAIDTLEILANTLNVADGVIIPMLDARRMEVYSAVFTPQHKKVRETKAEVLDENSFNDIAGPIHICGDGAAKFANISSHPGLVVHEGIVYPSATRMAELSYGKYKKSDTVDVAYFEPYYLKDFIALKKQQ